MPLNHKHVCLWHFFGSYLHHGLVLRCSDGIIIVYFCRVIAEDCIVSKKQCPGAADVRGLFATSRCYSKRVEAQNPIKLIDLDIRSSIIYYTAYTVTYNRRLLMKMATAWSFPLSLF